MERKDFIKTGALAAAGVGFSALHFPLFGRNISPGEKVVIGIMGTNGRGLEHIKSFTKIPNVEIAYICDVEDAARAKGIDLVEKLTGKKPMAVTDFRKILDNKDLDALAIAAPDHWHAPAAILACAAGKHVYVEKPCGHNPEEGEKLIKAARKYNRHVQMGDQRRSMPRLMDAMKQVHEGVIGNAYFAKGWYANNRKPIGIGKKIPVPGYFELGSYGRDLPHVKITAITWCIITGIGSGTGAPARPATTVPMKLIVCAGRWAWIFQQKSVPVAGVFRLRMTGRHPIHR